MMKIVGGLYIVIGLIMLVMTIQQWKSLREWQKKRDRLHQQLEDAVKSSNANNFQS